MQKPITNAKPTKKNKILDFFKFNLKFKIKQEIHIKILSKKH